MITVEFKEKPYSVKVSGHSGYAEAGKDIVCAGASTITYALMMTLYDLQWYSGWKDDEECMYISSPSNAGARKDIDTAFGFAYHGYKLLADHYPDNIRIIE